MKVIVLVACVTAAMVLPNAHALSRGTPVDASQPSRTPQRCQNIQLLIRSGQSQGAAGHIAVIYGIRNLWNQPCRLFGYPGIQLLDGNFHSLPTHVHRGPGNLLGAISPRLVPLGPYGRAYFALGYSDVPMHDGRCATARYLMIIPPNDFLPVVTYAAAAGQGILACGGNINLTPVTDVPRYRNSP